MLIFIGKQLFKGKYIHSKLKIYGEISSLEFSRSKRKTNLMNSAQVSRLSLKLKLIANAPCTSTKIYFPMVKGYNDHFCFRVFPSHLFLFLLLCFIPFFKFISYFFSNFFQFTCFFPRWLLLSYSVLST